MDYLVLGSIGFVAAITPGPDIFYIIRQAICRDFKTALVAVIGILFGNLIYLSLVGFGLGVVGTNRYFQVIVGFLGGIYLLKISYAIFHDKPHLESSCDTLSAPGLFKEALLLNLSNPKAMIFFAVVVTPFLTKNIFLSLGALFLSIALAFVLSAFVVSKIPISDRVLLIINKVASVVFLFFALLLFKSAYGAL